jgi:diketogulonate reductase-like aldo/keto reductase
VDGRRTSARPVSVRYRPVWTGWLGLALRVQDDRTAVELGIDHIDTSDCYATTGG